MSTLLRGEDASADRRRRARLGEHRTPPPEVAAQRRPRGGGQSPRPTSRRGQSAVEYMLALSVIAIVIAGAFSAMGAGVGGAFHNVRAVVGLPYP